MTTATLTRNATETALSLIRDENVGVEQLACHWQESEAFAAGLIDAVTGEIDWRHVWHMDDAVPSKAELADYERGFATAQLLIEQEAAADGWAECYALADAEAVQAAELLPLCDDDCPF